MNRAYVVEWILALESGQYEQGFGQLKDLRLAINDNGQPIRACFCCLGVAGDILVKHGVAEWQDDGTALVDRSGARARAHGFLTPDLAKVMGMVRSGLDDSPSTDNLGIGQSNLSNMNDEGVTHATIAWFLRERLAMYDAANGIDDPPPPPSPALVEQMSRMRNLARVDETP